MTATSTATLADLAKLASQGVLFALIDACDEPDVPPRCAEMGPPRAVSLYRGNAEKDFAAFAPYLTQLKPEDVDWISEKLWAKAWGYFVIARSDLGTLRTHFRHFLEVVVEGKKMFFRFYDPRVLRTFLETSDPQAIRQFFWADKCFGNDIFG